MSVSETFGSKGLCLPSPEAAKLIVSVAENSFETMVAQGVPYRRRNNKERIRFGAYVSSSDDRDSLSAEQRERREAGTSYVESAEMRRDALTGDISYLAIHSYWPQSSPDSLTFKANSHKTRVQFPKPHTADETQRVVVDSWDTYEASMLGNIPQLDTQEEKAEYDRHYGDIFKKKTPQGLPVAAEDVSHLVVGRPLELLSDEGSRQVLYVVNALGIAVQKEIGFRSEVFAGSLSRF